MLLQHSPTYDTWTKELYDVLQGRTNATKSILPGFPTSCPGHQQLAGTRGGSSKGQAALWQHGTQRLHKRHAASCTAPQLFHMRQGNYHILSSPSNNSYKAVSGCLLTAQLSSDITGTASQHAAPGIRQGAPVWPRRHQRFQPSFTIQTHGY